MLFSRHIWLIATLALTLSGIQFLEAQTPEQDRVARFRAIRLIEEGEGLIASGQQTLARRPTLLNPNQDMAPIHARGKQQIEEGKALVAEGNAIIRELNERIERARQQRLESIEVREFTSSPIAVCSTEQGLLEMFEYMSTELPKKVSHRLFFHNGFYNNQGKYSVFPTLYEWIEIQLNNLGAKADQISLLPEVEWVVDDQHPLGAIRHERLDPFRSTHGAAIIVAEVLNWGDCPWLVLSLTTSETEKWTVLDHKTWLLKRDRAARQWFGATEKKEENLGTQEFRSIIVDKLEFLEFVSSRNGDFVHRLDNGKGNPFRPSLHLWQNLVKQSLVENDIPLNNYDWVRRCFFTKERPYKLVDPRTQASLIVSPAGNLDHDVNGGEPQFVTLESHDDSLQRSLHWGEAKLERVASEVVPDSP